MDLDQESLIRELAMRDALLHIDSLNPAVIEAYAKKREKYYEQEFKKIRNITVLDPEPGVSLEHSFDSKCYIKVVQEIIKKHQSPNN